MNGTEKASDLVRLMRANRNLAQANETLLSSLTLSGPSGLPRSLMMSSTQPGEGKTLLASMLALSAAMAGKNILLVDADLRRPRVHQVFARDNRVGFGDLLSGAKTMDEAMTTLEIADVGAQAPIRLSVMTSGAGDSADFNRIGRERFGEVVQLLSARFDAVIFDCPPVLAVNDALFLAAVVEGVVFVVEAGAVSQHQAKVAKARLEKAGGKLLGFVMNRLDEEQLGLAGEAYQRYYSQSEA